MLKQLVTIMPFNNRKLNFVRIYGKDVNLSKIVPLWWNSYHYTAQNKMHWFSFPLFHSIPISTKIRLKH